MSIDAFLADSTVEDLIQNNIAQVDKLEEEQQRKLLRIFRRVRQDLQDRLLIIREGTFTEQQLNVVLVQVQAAILAIKQDLQKGLVDASEILGQRGISDLIREVKRFSKKFEGSVQPINIDAAVIASRAQTFLVNKHEASLSAYSEALRSQITTQITQSMIGRDTSQRTVSQLVSNVGRFFVGEEWKLTRIVRTELHNIYNYSKLEAMNDARAGIPDLKKSLMHPIDNRTGEDSKQLAEQNPIVDMDEPFVFTFVRQRQSGPPVRERREFMFPPDRPNDRAILVPFRKEWGDNASKFSSRELSN